MGLLAVWDVRVRDHELVRVEGEDVAQVLAHTRVARREQLDPLLHLRAYSQAN